jgi:hypothetical protein
MMGESIVEFLHKKLPLLGLDKIKHMLTITVKEPYNKNIDKAGEYNG